MPRSRSSGALSIEPYSRTAIVLFFVCSTFVIAAVKVVFPWSTCPMVPTFTCGFVRSNFALAMKTKKEKIHFTKPLQDRKSTRLNSSHVRISYAVFCLKKKKRSNGETRTDPTQSHSTV